eukprot:g17078.t1
MRSGSGNISLSRAHGRDYAGPGAGACTAIVHVLAYSALALSSKFVLDDLRFPYPLFLAAVGSLGAPWLCLVSGETADVELQDARITGTKLNSVSGILLDGTVSALVSGLATTGLLFLDPISWGVVMANLPVFHIAMTIGTRNAKRILLVCRAGRGARENAPGDDRAVVEGAAAGVLDHLAEKDRTRDAKIKNGRGARGVPLAAFGILFCVPALLVASLRDVLQMQEAEHEERVELERPRSAISAGALVLGAGATGAVRKSAAAAAFSNDKGEVDSEQEDVDDNSDAANNGGLSGAGLIATCTDAARQQILFRSEFCSMCVQSICLIACAADLEGVEAGHALLTFTTTSTARTAIIEPGSLLPTIALCALLTGVVRLLSDELRRWSDGDKGGNPSLMPLPWLGYCSVVVIMAARLVCFGGVRGRAQRIAGPVVLSETQMAFTFCMLAAALWSTGAVGPPVKENTKKKPKAMKGRRRAEDVDVHTPTANELQSVADLCPNEQTTLQRDISERIVPEENVFLVAPSCPIEYIKGYRSTLFPNTPRVTCFDHAAADKSIDLISDFLENQDAELAAAGGVFATFLRRNRKALVKGEATSIRESEGNEKGNGTHGPPRPESGVEYRFASGEVGLCLGRWSRDAVPDQWRFQNNVLASYPRNPTLLYILREQMENVAREDYRKGVLGITGPDAFGGGELCEPYYASLFGRKKVYCSNLIGGEHGEEDDCNVACKDNHN